MSIRRRTLWTLVVLSALCLSAAVARAQDQSAAPAAPAAAAASSDIAPAAPESAAAPAVQPAADNSPARASDELAAQAAEKRNWLLQIFGWGMWPLWACSIILVALILERRKSLRADRIIDPSMVDRVAALVAELKIDDAQKAAAASDTVVGRAWAQAFHEFSLGGMTLAEALTNSTVVAMKPLKRNLTALATVGVISPLLGLLGTILGMIIIFGQIAATGGADKGELAGGIGLALFTTAGGLIVAIPSILGNRYFTARLTGFAEQAEAAINRINYRYSHARAQADAEAADAKADGKSRKAAAAAGRNA